LAKAEAKVARIDAQIEDLVCERDRELNNVAILRSMLSPIRKMPTELLEEFFFLAIHREKDEFSSLQRRMFILTQVCALWRTIVHATPRLWAEPLYLRPEKITKKYVALTQLWLGRSYPLPLSVSLETWKLRDKDRISPLVNTLLSVSTCLKDLTLDLPSLSLLEELPQSSLDLLETLSLSDSRSSRSPHEPVTAFLTASRLRSVTLNVNHITLFPMPWSQLTALVIVNHTTLGTCRRILLQCMNLVSAKFETAVGTADADISDPPVVLSSLEQLDLRLDESAPGGLVFPFFQSFALPALKALDLIYILGSNDPGWSREIFSQFLLRSPNLNHFECWRSELDADDLMSVLHNIPLSNYRRP